MGINTKFKTIFIQKNQGKIFPKTIQKNYETKIEKEGRCLFIVLKNK